MQYFPEYGYNASDLYEVLVQALQESIASNTFNEIMQNISTQLGANITTSISVVEAVTSDFEVRYPKTLPPTLGPPPTPPFFSFAVIMGFIAAGAVVFFALVALSVLWVQDRLDKERKKRVYVADIEEPVVVEAVLI
jgi:amino acid transporter